MSVITAIATANPENKFSQKDIAEFMLRTMKIDNGQSKKLRAIFRASGIEYRHSVLQDYGRTSGFSFYPENGAAHPSTRTRLTIFRNEALPLSHSAASTLFRAATHVRQDEITHLIVVCCTGMYAPGLDIDLVKALGLRSDVHRTAINFMGCYAAFNALKIADAICTATRSAKVLVVCTELCSLHFQREGSDDNMLANALFGDGSAAVLVEGKSASRLQLSLEAFHNDLATEGRDDMAWSVGDMGFEMRLSSFVPAVIRSGIGTLTRSLMAKLSTKGSDVAHYAIHPGGKKILEVVESELNLPKEKNAAAYEVLRRYGNMSSPTVLFVLHELLSKLTVQNVNEDILSFAFGPGLTMESMVLKIRSL